MWIIPNNHPLYSAFAPECVSSKTDLLQLSDKNSELLPTWRETHLSLKTWSGKWNRVWWLPHLFGRMLKPLMERSFSTELMESLGLIPVHHFQESEKCREQKMNDTFTHTFQTLYGNLDDQLLSDSKTLSSMRLSGSMKFMQTFGIWVTQLKQEYSLRLNAALIIRGNGSSFSQSGKIWATPTSRDWKDTPDMLKETTEGRKRLDQLPRQVFHWHFKDNSNLSMSRVALSAEWVMLLMGTTLQQTFFAWQEMQSSHKQQNSRSEP